MGAMPAPTTTRPVVTIGYEGRTADQLLEALRDRSIDLLVDVRLTPLSRKPGLSKRGLAERLASAGIRYLHVPELGNPKDNRDGFRAGDERSRGRFRELLSADDASAALDELQELAQEHVIALLCFERDAGECHRELVGEELARRAPVALAHA